MYMYNIICDRVCENQPYVGKNGSACFGGYCKSTAWTFAAHLESIAHCCLTIFICATNIPKTKIFSWNYVNCHIQSAGCIQPFVTDSRSCSFILVTKATLELTLAARRQLQSTAASTKCDHEKPLRVWTALLNPGICVRIFYHIIAPCNRPMYTIWLPLDRRSS